MTSTEQEFETRFVWDHGGSEVHITVRDHVRDGDHTYQLVKSKEGFFETTIWLNRGRYEYRYAVDGKWVHDPDLPALKNEYGHFSNIVKVVDSKTPIQNKMGNISNLEKRKFGLKANTPGNPIEKCFSDENFYDTVRSENVCSQYETFYSINSEVSDDSKIVGDDSRSDDEDVYPDLDDAIDEEISIFLTESPLDEKSRPPFKSKTSSISLIESQNTADNSPHTSSKLDKTATRSELDEIGGKTMSMQQTLHNDSSDLARDHTHVWDACTQAEGQTFSPIVTGLQGQCDKIQEIAHHADKIQEITNQSAQIQQITHQSSQIQEITHQSSQIQEITHQSGEIQEKIQQGDQKHKVTNECEQIQEITHQSDQIQKVTNECEQIQEITHQSDQTQKVTNKCEQIQEITNQSDQTQKVTQQSDEVKTVTQQHSKIQTLQSDQKQKVTRQYNETPEVIHPPMGSKLVTESSSSNDTYISQLQNCHFIDTSVPSSFVSKEKDILNLEETTHLEDTNKNFKEQPPLDQENTLSTSDVSLNIIEPDKSSSISIDLKDGQVNITGKQINLLENTSSLSNEFGGGTDNIVGHASRNEDNSSPVSNDSKENIIGYAPSNQENSSSISRDMRDSKDNIIGETPSIQENSLSTSNDLKDAEENILDYASSNQENSSSAPNDSRDAKNSVIEQPPNSKENSSSEPNNLRNAKDSIIGQPAISKENCSSIPDELRNLQKNSQAQSDQDDYSSVSHNLINVEDNIKEHISSSSLLNDLGDIRKNITEDVPSNPEDSSYISNDIKDVQGSNEANSSSISNDSRNENKSIPGEAPGIIPVQPTSIQDNTLQTLNDLKHVQENITVLDHTDQENSSSMSNDVIDNKENMEDNLQYPQENDLSNSNSIKDNDENIMEHPHCDQDIQSSLLNDIKEGNSNMKEKLQIDQENSFSISNNMTNISENIIPQIECDQKMEQSQCDKIIGSSSSNDVKDSDKNITENPECDQENMSLISNDLKNASANMSDKSTKENLSPSDELGDLKSNKTLLTNNSNNNQKFTEHISCSLLDSDIILPSHCDEDETKNNPSIDITNNIQTDSFNAEKSEELHLSTGQTEVNKETTQSNFISVESKNSQQENTSVDEVHVTLDEATTCADTVQKNNEIPVGKLIDIDTDSSGSICKENQVDKMEENTPEKDEEKDGNVNNDDIKCNNSDDIILPETLIIPKQAEGSSLISTSQSNQMNDQDYQDSNDLISGKPKDVFKEINSTLGDIRKSQSRTSFGLGFNQELEKSESTSKFLEEQKTKKALSESEKMRNKENAAIEKTVLVNNTVVDKLSYENNNLETFRPILSPTQKRKIQEEEEKLAKPMKLDDVFSDIRSVSILDMDRERKIKGIGNVNLRPQVIQKHKKEYSRGPDQDLKKAAREQIAMPAKPAKFVKPKPKPKPKPLTPPPPPKSPSPAPEIQNPPTTTVAEVTPVPEKEATPSPLKKSKSNFIWVKAKTPEQKEKTPVSDLILPPEEDIIENNDILVSTKIASPKIGINGFDKLGRLVLRFAIQYGLDILAINDPFIPLHYMVYSLKFDLSTCNWTNKMKEINVRESPTGELVINGKAISVFSEVDPKNIPWDLVGVNLVIEATGVNTTKEDAQLHLSTNGKEARIRHVVQQEFLQNEKNLQAESPELNANTKSDTVICGARKVIIAGPSLDAPLFAMGVNENKIKDDIPIFSHASAATSALAPVLKLIHESFKIKWCSYTLLRSVIGTNKDIKSKTVGPNSHGKQTKWDFHENLIPTADPQLEEEIIRLIPAMRTRLSGMCVYVPAPEVSMFDLKIHVEDPRDNIYRDVCKRLKQAAEGSHRKVLKYCLKQTQDSSASSLFVGSTQSVVVDAKLGGQLAKDTVKLVLWFDNESGFANRIIDLVVMA